MQYGQNDGTDCTKCGKFVWFEDCHWDTIDAENDLPYCDQCWMALE